MASASAPAVATVLPAQAHTLAVAQRRDQRALHRSSLNPHGNSTFIAVASKPRLGTAVTTAPAAADKTAARGKSHETASSLVAAPTSLLFDDHADAEKTTPVQDLVPRQQQHSDDHTNERFRALVDRLEEIHVSPAVLAPAIDDAMLRRICEYRNVSAWSQARQRLNLPATASAGTTASAASGKASSSSPTRDANGARRRPHSALSVAATAALACHVISNVIDDPLGARKGDGGNGERNESPSPRDASGLAVSPSATATAVGHETVGCLNTESVRLYVQNFLHTRLKGFPPVVQDDGSTEATPARGLANRERAAQRLAAHRDALRIMVDRFRVSCSSILSAVADEMTSFLALFNTLSAQASEFHTSLASFERQHIALVEKVRQQTLRELQTVVNNSADREVELAVAHRVGAELEARLADLKASGDAHAVVSAQQTASIHELLRDASSKRSLMAEIQEKANGVIEENRYLRSLCHHSHQLLKDLEHRKIAEDNLRLSHEAAVARLRGEISALTIQRNAFDGHLKSLKAVIEKQSEEIALLRMLHSESDNAAAHLRNERDAYVECFTPRPAGVRECAAWLHNTAGYDTLQILVQQQQQQSAGNERRGSAALTLPHQRHHPSEIPTAAVLAAMHATATELHASSQLLKAKLGAHGALVEFLRDDDFERLQAALQHPTFPSHSLCVAALGSGGNSGSGVDRFVAPHLRCGPGVAPGGVVAIRAMSVPEVLICIDEIRSLRRRHLADPRLLADFPTASHTTAGFFADRCPNALAAVEDAYSFDHSLRLCSFSPQVALFSRIVAGTAGETVFEEAQRCVDSTVAHLRAALARHGTTADKKRRVIKKKHFVDAIRRACPWFSEADYARLKVVAANEVKRCGQSGMAAPGSGTVGGGNGSNNAATKATTAALGTLSKDDIPLELLLNPPTDGVALGEDASLVVSVGTGVSLLSPFAAALFRQFVVACDVLRVEVGEAAVAHAQTAVPSTGSPRSRVLGSLLGSGSIVAGDGTETSLVVAPDLANGGGRHSPLSNGTLGDAAVAGSNVFAGLDTGSRSPTKSRPLSRHASLLGTAPRPLTSFRGNGTGSPAPTTPNGGGGGGGVLLGPESLAAALAAVDPARPAQSVAAVVDAVFARAPPFGLTVEKFLGRLIAAPLGVKHVAPVAPSGGSEAGALPKTQAATSPISPLVGVSAEPFSVPLEEARLDEVSKKSMFTLRTGGRTKK